MRWVLGASIEITSEYFCDSYASCRPAARHLDPGVSWLAGTRLAHQDPVGSLANFYCLYKRRDRSPPSPPDEASSKENKSEVAILPAPSRSPVKFFHNEGAARAFEYFCSNSVPQTNRLVDSAFWSEVVLQLAHQEPAVKSSVLSLGSLQRSFELKQEQEKTLAMSYYGQAVREAQDLVQRSAASKDPTNVLVCAILFHCIEIGVGHHGKSPATQ